MSACKTPLCSRSPATPSDYDPNRSSAKRISEPLFQMVHHSHYRIDWPHEAFSPQIDQDDTCSPFETTGYQIHLIIGSDDFKQTAMDRMKQLGLIDARRLPILVVACLCTRDGSLMELDREDLMETFERFQDLLDISMAASNEQALVLFESFTSAYVAWKLLNHLQVRQGQIQLEVDWSPPQQYASLPYDLVQKCFRSCGWNKHQAAAQPGLTNNSTNNNIKPAKFTCRYDIQIENDRQFQVARRIIGPKGCNMKRIIEESLIRTKGKIDTANENLKLRLRGRGSGYKEGPQQQESSQALHLCISAKDQDAYQYACERVEQLLEDIYRDYYDYTSRQSNGICMRVKKLTLSQGLGSQIFQSVDLQSSYGANNGLCSASMLSCIQPLSFQVVQQQPYESYNSRICPEKILELLELRNRARRELNFSQADRIRHYLRSCGVCLIDEKGRRGKAVEVTTWKYIY